LGFLRDFWVASKGCVCFWAESGVPGVKLGGLGNIGKEEVRKNELGFAKK
jgi:hypothetical protein